MQGLVAVAGINGKRIVTLPVEIGRNDGYMATKGDQRRKSTERSSMNRKG